jgi:uncharacterized membrane protein
MRAPASHEWLMDQGRGADASSASPEDELATPWAGALGPEDDVDATTVFARPNRVPADRRGSLGGPDPDRAPARDWGTTTLRIGPRTAAGLSYLFGWVSGLVIYFNERENKYVRFHAVQSILLTSALTVFGVLAYLASGLLDDAYVGTHQMAFHRFSVAVGLLAIFSIAIIWFASMIAAWSGEYLRLPIVSSYAERYAALPPSTLDE